MKSAKPVFIVVLALLVVFGGVQISQAAPIFCNRVGATKIVSAKSFTCVRQAGKLVWKVSSATTTTTTTATTTTTSTVVGSQIAPVVTVGALASCQPVSVSWRGASPDTGVYAVQWTLVSAAGTYNFNSYSMFSARGTSAVLPRWFTSGATYALRVFGMRADWDGISHSAQNVTPHSTVETFTMPICVAAAAATTTTTTTVALTCATGGVCVVGDTGPGGGIVFYVKAAGGTFTSTGSDCGTACKYLEAAPTSWATSTVNSCATPGTSTSDPKCSWATLSTPINNQVTAVSGADGLIIGTGYQNSVDIVAQSGNVVATSAALLARAYAGGSKSDWYLPSKNELDELRLQQATVGLASSSYFWSSSESSASGAWSQNFGGFQSGEDKSFNFRSVRAVRAFG